MLTGLEYICNYHSSLPNAPGVYRMIGAAGVLLYIGKAKNLSQRVANYLNMDRLSIRLQKMVNNTVAMEVITTKNEVEALLLEANLIKTLQPRYNILLRDDKSFPYILIRDDHQFSQITKFRGTTGKQGKYFGPFASAADVDSTISHMQRIFQLRNCSDNYFKNRSRPCLLYQIKKCSAPCVGKISESDYRESTMTALDFLSGKTTELQQKLADKMEQASKLQNYELAAIYRDRIKSLTNIQSGQNFLNTTYKNADIFGLYGEVSDCCMQVFFIRAGQNYGNLAYFPTQIEDCSEGNIITAFLMQFYQTHPLPELIITSHQPDDHLQLEQALIESAQRKVKVQYKKNNAMVVMAVDNAKLSLTRMLSSLSKQKELMEKVAKIFQMPNLQRIEVYDNSHIGGAHAVGVMVVATNAGFVKAEYRRFKIKNSESGDDYAMLKEVLTRRVTELLKKYPEYETGIWPDLMLIDGGKGHLSVANEVLAGLKISSIKLVCISKGVDRHAGKEQFHSIGQASFTLAKDSMEMRYLQILRDEAHNTAIRAHKRMRSKAITISKLDQIPGIGPKRKKTLLHHFGAYDEVALASVKDLAALPGIDTQLAEQIYAYLRRK